ncbi:MAG: hypothetical protein D6725_04475 [Planctomycetota bacterium]|nr:MAG: hypothetical protein D6725_04475 [Planctomycetota bacterium]
MPIAFAAVCIPGWPRAAHMAGISAVGLKMALVEIRWNADRRFLRQFGMALLAFAALVGAVHWGRTGDAFGALWIWGVAAAVVSAGLVYTPVLRGLYLGWMLAIYPIAFIVSLCALAVVFYGVITPVGLLLRAFGYDPLQRRFDPDATTYWVPRSNADDPRRYLRQY